jgi:hypothetical protein
MSDPNVNQLLALGQALVNTATSALTDDKQVQRAVDAAGDVVLLWAKHIIDGGSDPHEELETLMATAERAGEAALDAKFPPEDTDA